MKRICVFCGSRPGAAPQYAKTAVKLGGVLARRGIGLVYGGGRVGLMGILADAVLAEGGEVIGVIPRALMDMEVGHTGLKDLRVVGSMHERKALMEKLSDGFIAMPGGFGTLDEFCEILTWAQLGIHKKPYGLLNPGGYFDKFLDFIDHSVSQGFVHSKHRKMILESADPAKLVAKLARR